MIESIFSFVRIRTSLFSNPLSTDSKSPVEICTFIFRPKSIVSNFLNSENFSDAKARNGQR